MQKIRLFLSVVIALILFSEAPAHGKGVNPLKYGVVNSFDRSVQERSAGDSLGKMLMRHPQLSNKNVIINIEPLRTMNDKTLDFYMLLALCLFLGVIRYIDPRYFKNIWRAFSNPTLSSRQIKEQMENAGFQNLLMNIFFSLVSGAYIFYAVRLVTPKRTGNIPPSLLILMLIAGMMGIYVAKYAVIRFSGWAFKVEGITEHYIYNVFLINKVLSVLLLPFTVLLAFADPVWTGPALIISLIIAGILLVNRYTRSWQVFGSFFQYSKFHFFTYLCASELLPVAVLMKLLVRGFLYK